jgi:hypothetical protein
MIICRKSPILSIPLDRSSTGPYRRIPGKMFFGKEPVYMDYYTSTSNLRMPPYARVDLALNISIF